MTDGALQALMARCSHLPSDLGTHEDDCCWEAKSWLCATDMSRALWGDDWQDPLWIRERWGWGPSERPLYWCDLFTEDRVDCGALASITSFLFRMRGDEATTCQAILEYPDPSILSWTRLWQKAGLQASWIEIPYVYHEVTAMLTPIGADFWDPTENRHLEPSDAHRGGFAVLKAIRMSRGSIHPAYPALFGRTELREDAWTLLGQDQGGSATT